MANDNSVAGSTAAGDFGELGWSSIRIAEATGKLENERFSLNIENSVIRVRDLKTGFLVGYSSMQADYEQSLFEFINDFFVEN